MRFLGRVVLLLAAAQLLPVLCCLIYAESSAAISFLISAGVSGLVGAAMAFGVPAKGELYRREAILIVVGGWVLASLAGAVPYYLTGTFSSPIDALFESASGFTTTGATVLTDFDGAGRGVLL